MIQQEDVKRHEIIVEKIWNSHPIWFIWYYSALVTREGESDPLKIQLFDNGRGADLISEDGIYSTYFTNYDGVKGRYTLNCQVNPAWY